MFIPDFWCGVLVTILAEIATLVFAALSGRLTVTNRKDEEDDK